METSDEYPLPRCFNIQLYIHLQLQLEKKEDEMTADDLPLGSSDSRMKKRKRVTCRRFSLKLLDRQHLFLTFAHHLQTYKPKLETQLILIVAGCGRGIVLRAANDEEIKGTALKALPHHPLLGCTLS